MQPSDRVKANIRSNIVKSVVLVAGFPLVLPSVIFVFTWPVLLAFGQPDALRFAVIGFLSAFLAVVVATIVWLPIGYLMNQWIIDRATGARLVGRSEEPRLWSIFENLCARCGMRLPALRIIETEVLNAYASGLSEGRYSVTVTRGLLDTLNDDEIEGVLAHELAHIRNQDVQLLVVAIVLVGMIPILHDVVMRIFWALVMTFLNIYRFVFTVIPVPMARAMFSISYTLIFWAGKGVAFVIGIASYFCSLVIHFALSRQREFMADAGAAEMTGKPEALISALRRISCNNAVPTAISGIREMLFDSPAIAGIGGLLATHPPVEKRIEALAQYAREVQRRLEQPDRELPALQAASPIPAVHSEQVVAAFHGILLRTLGGTATQSSPEKRQLVYRRARQAIINRRQSGSFTSGEQADKAESALEAAIERIELAARPG